MGTLDRVALGVVIVGAVNWLLVGLLQWDLVAALFGGQSGVLSRIVYVIVGIAGLYCISLLVRRFHDGRVVINQGAPAT